MSRRTVGLAGGVLVVALTTTGCPGSTWRTTAVDRARLATLTKDPIVAHHVGRLDARPGVDIHDGTTYRRGVVDATLYRSEQTTASAVAARMAGAAAALRRAGWTTYHARCAPPVAAADPWTWSVSAYRMAGRTSYAARLTGQYSPAGSALVAVRLLAPDAAEPADLFPDRPAGLARTCADTAYAGRAGVPAQGPDITVSQVAPAGHRKPGQRQR